MKTALKHCSGTREGRNIIQQLLDSCLTSNHVWCVLNSSVDQKNALILALEHFSDTPDGYAIIQRLLDATIQHMTLTDLRKVPQIILNALTKH